MQKNYKHYIIKSTANNKRYKLYNKDEPNVEIFMSPYLSDVMAFISIEENELYVGGETLGLFPTLQDIKSDEPLSEEATQNIVGTFASLQVVAEQLREEAFKPIIIKKKPIVKKKTSMKMKKKA